MPYAESVCVYCFTTCLADVLNFSLVIVPCYAALLEHNFMSAIVLSAVENKFCPLIHAVCTAWCPYLEKACCVFG